MARFLFLTQGVPSASQGGSGIFNHYMLEHLHCNNICHSSVFVTSSSWWNAHEHTLGFNALFRSALDSCCSSHQEYLFLFTDVDAGSDRCLLSQREVRELTILQRLLGNLCSLEDLIRRYMFLSSIPDISSFRILIHGDWGWMALAAYMKLAGIAIVGDPPAAIAWDRARCNILAIAQHPTLASFLDLYRQLVACWQFDVSERRILNYARKNCAFSLGFKHLSLVTLCPYHSLDYKLKGFNFGVLPWFSPANQKLANQQLLHLSSTKVKSSIKILHLGDLRTSASMSSLKMLSLIFKSLRRFSVKTDFEFLMVGVTSASAERSLLRDVGSDTRFKVTFAGSCDDLSPYIAASDMMIAPMDKRSGIRTRVITAFASGLPVIAHHSCSFNLPYAIDGHHWLLASNPHELSMAIIALVDNPALRLRLASNAYDLWRRQFSPSINVGAIADLVLMAAP